MKTTFAALTTALVASLLLSACAGNAGGNGAGPLPNSPAVSHSRIRPGDNGPQDLHAGGADMPAYAYNLGIQPVGSYNQAQPPPGQGSLFYSAPTKGTIYYCITGSTDGRKAFENYEDSGFPPTGPCAPLGQTATGFGGRQDPLDFAGTAVALSSTECCTSGTPYYNGRLVGSVTWGQPFEFPQIGASIVFAYRPQDFKAQVSKIKLSTWTYCAIAGGTVTDWNDPAITADNGTSVTGGSSEPITFYFRGDGGATTYDLTNHLNTVCNVAWKKPYNKAPYQGPSRSAAWSFGVSSTWPGPGSSGFPNPNFIGETGDPGIIAAIQTTPYATGYITGGFAKGANPKIGQALLQNGFANGKPIWVVPTDKTTLKAALGKVTAANIQYGEGNDGNPLGSSTPWCQLFIPTNLYVAPPKKTYPIVGISYLLFYGQNNGVHLSDKTALIKYLVSSQSNKVVGQTEYVPLSTSLETAVLNALNGNGGSQAPCLQ